MAAQSLRRRCFLDISVSGVPAGRLVIELFTEHTPETAENFRLLCTNLPPRPSYCNTPFHRVIEFFMIQGGDNTRGDGRGGTSAVRPDGGAFNDENLHWRKIDEKGLVCMANSGKNTNKSQFFITLEDGEESGLSGKHTCFGKVVAGWELVERIAGLQVGDRDRPVADVRVEACGELVFRKKKPQGGAGADAEAAEGHVERRGGGSRSRSRGCSHTRNRSRSRDRDRERRRRYHHHRHHRRSHSRSRSPLERHHRYRHRERSTGHAPAGDMEEHSRGRSRTPQPRHRHSRRHDKHHDDRHHRDRSPSRHRFRPHSRSRARDWDDPYADERMAREEREREMAREHDGRGGGNNGGEGEGNGPKIRFKGRGSMKYWEKRRWGGGGEYGRLD